MMNDPGVFLPDLDGSSWSEIWVRHLADASLWRGHARAVRMGGALRAWSARCALTDLMHVFAACDADVFAHCRRTAHIVAAIAAACDWPASMTTLGIAAAMVHDIGKVCVPSSVWRRCGPVRPTDDDALRLHVIVGAALTACIPALRDLAPIIRAHHERFDGTGYPDRACGDAIPRAARGLAVADAYDAMRRARPYRAPLSPDAIRAELLRGRGRQWDPEAVDAMVSLIDGGVASAIDGSVMPDECA